MPDLDDQLRDYARWLADHADAAAMRRCGDAANERTGPGRWWLAGAAAVVVIVIGGLAVLTRAPSDAPAPQASAATTLPPSSNVNVGGGLRVPVVGEPAVIDGVAVHQGAASTADVGELVQPLAGDPLDVSLAPIAASDFPFPADFDDGRPAAVAVIGANDAVAVAIHGRRGPAGEIRCALLVSLVNDSWLEACGGGSLVQASGVGGDWLVWLDLPAEAVLVTAVDPSGRPVAYQRPTARTVAFPRTGSGQTLLAYDLSGDVLAEERLPGPASDDDTATTTTPTTTEAAGPAEPLTFDVAATFGDVGSEAMAVASDGRVVAAAGSRLLVRDRSGDIRTVELPTEVASSWVGPGDIAVVWGDDGGAEVDLATGDVISELERDDDLWRRGITRPDEFRTRPGRPANPLGLELLLHAGATLPVVEGAGCFETVSADQSRTWTFERPAECSATVEKIAPMADGGYLVTLRPPNTVEQVVHPLVLRPDGTVEALAEHRGAGLDAHPEPNGLTVLTIEGTTAVVEHIPVETSGG